MGWELPLKKLRSDSPHGVPPRRGPPRMLLQNSLFRCGGAAILLSNRWTDAPCARFKLLHLVRTQLMTDQAYGQGRPPGRRAWP